MTHLNLKFVFPLLRRWSWRRGERGAGDVAGVRGAGHVAAPRQPAAAREPRRGRAGPRTPRRLPLHRAVHLHRRVRPFNNHLNPDIAVLFSNN